MMELKDDSLEEHPTSRHYQSHDCTIPGMESVVATVSGYHGSERFNLIKLISQTGANYVGVMSRSITHLVCWKFEGEKFKLAKKFKILIVSHCWFEECVKAGRRILEDPYVLQSGQETGPLQFDGVLVAKKAGPFTKKPCKVLLDLSNVGDDSEEPVIIPKGRGSSRCVRSDSCLLNENLFSNGSSKSNGKGAKKPLEEELWSPTRYYQGESSSHYTTCSVRRKKSICNAVASTITAETSHCPDGGTNENLLIYSGDSAEGISQEGCSYAKESLWEELKNDDQIEIITRFPTSKELSCVICLSDYSSTRGVLSCGHRFCFSCIQRWADQSASMRKIPTCPLCNASFVSITKFDDADTSDQKIYSQTIPYAASTTNIFILPDRETSRIGAQGHVW